MVGLTGLSYLDVFKLSYRMLVISLISATFAGMMYFVFFQYPYSPLSASKNAITFTLTPGTSVKGMVKQLQVIGALDPFQAQLFRWWIQFKGASKSLQAGEYIFSYSITPDALLAKLIKGDVVQYSLTFAEGSTFEENLKTISLHPAIKKTVSGKSNQEIMSMLGEPEIAPEGLLFPDTYYFTSNTTDIALLRRARLTMKEKVNVAWEKRDKGVIVQSPYEALILASIIEKEASVKEERYLVSGVFQQRLAKKMRLQADPTVSYGAHKKLGENLTRNDLKQDTPYNTYLHHGLPPTPIAMPGWDAIEAALHPSMSAALYFVAKGDGTHYFSNSLEEHNIAVFKYQRGIGPNE